VTTISSATRWRARVRSFRSRALSTAFGLLAVACAPAAAAPGTATQPVPTSTATPAATSSAGTPAIKVLAARYGTVQIHTSPRAACTLRVQIDAGTFGDGPPGIEAGTADAQGSLSWTYSAPPVPEGRGQHVVTCTGGRRSSEVVAGFEVALRSLKANGFTVRIQPVDPVRGLAGINARLDPSLLPTRDAIAARLTTDLEKEWTQATRGLGALALVPSSADIVVYVLPGRGTSVHARSSDGTQRVELYVVGERGVLTPDNALSVALHELGHIWCCFGPDAAPDGHWRETTADPLLEGVNQFGLMTHPVTCLVAARAPICPNRFSARELRAMGFTEIPPPPPDPCVTRSRELKARLASLDAAIDASAAALDDLRARISGIAERMQAIRAQYPSRVLPPEAFASYTELMEQYNGLLAEFERKRSAHNANVDLRNSVVHQLSDLPC